MDPWIHSLAGFGVGLVVGITGIGGGALMTPILVLVFGVAPAAAVGTDLWFAAITKLVGGAVHHKQGRVDTEVLRRLCWGSVPAAIATLAWMHFSHASKLQSSLVLKSLGAVLLLTVLAMVFKNQLHAFGRQLRTTEPVDFKRWQPPATVLAGAVLGVLVTLTSVGAGVLGTVMLVYLYPLRMTPPRLVGTDIAHAIPLTVVAGTGHALMGNVDLPLLGWLLAGSIPGILLGSSLAGKLPDTALRWAIAAVLTFTAFKLLTSA